MKSPEGIGNQQSNGIRLLEALKEEFGEELVVFLDRAGYFYARDLWEFVSGERETETVASCPLYWSRYE